MSGQCASVLMPETNISANLQHKVKKGLKTPHLLSANILNICTSYIRK